MNFVPAAITALALSHLALGQNIVTHQQIVSAKSGVIHYYEGTVLQDGKAIEIRNGHFDSMKDGSVLTTEAGRAEILLQPSVFLRLGEDSAIRMLSTKLTDTRVEVLDGTVIVEVGDAEFDKQYGLKFLFRDATADINHPGLYRIDAADSRIRVYKGELSVIAKGETTVLPSGREMVLGGDVLLAKFDPKTGDPLFRWASRRAEYLSTANIASANSLRSSGYSFLGQQGGWVFNPYYGMMTYMPYNGIYNSPFGYRFYSPGRVYIPQPGYGYRGGNTGGNGGGSSVARGNSGPTYNPSYGYNTYESRGSMASAPSSGYSTPVASAPGSSAPAAAAPSGGMSRGGDSSGGSGAAGARSGGR